MLKRVDSGQNLWYNSTIKTRGVFCKVAGRLYSHQLDAKKRMRIPAKFREELGPNYSITIGTGGCLYVYTEEEVTKVRKTLAKANRYKGEQLKAARFILANIWDAEEDKQGRILLPDNLIKYAKIEKNVTIFKGPTCIEIWSEEVWNDYINSITFDNIAEALEELSKDD